MTLWGGGGSERKWRCNIIRLIILIAIQFMNKDAATEESGEKEKSGFVCFTRQHNVCVR